MSVNPPASLCKPTRARTKRLTQFAVVVAVVALVGCHAHRSRRTVSLPQLEQGTLVLPTQVRRSQLSSDADLGPSYHELAPRLAAIVVRTEAEWGRLRAAAPEIGPQPDLSAGAVVGLISRAGSPVSGRWPLSIKHVRVSDGAGLLVGAFSPGSYQPDGAAYIETAYISGLETVLVVEINGLRYVL